MRRLRRRFTSTLMELDRRGLAAVNRVRATPIEPVTVASSHAGRGGLLWFALAVGVGSGPRPLRREEGIGLAGFAIGSGLALSVLLARAFERPRPCDRGFGSLIPCPEGGSFPSDQTAAAFAAAEFLGWLRPGARMWLRPLASLIAISRVVVGAHYPTDVFAGAAMGTAVGRLTSVFGERRCGSHEREEPAL